MLRNVAINGGKSLDGAIEDAAWTNGRMVGKHALRFKYPDDYVRINLPQTVNSVTVAAWVYVNLLDLKFSGLLMSDTWRRTGQWELQLDSEGRFTFDVYDFDGRPQLYTYRNQSSTMSDSDGDGRISPLYMTMLWRPSGAMSMAVPWAVLVSASVFHFALARRRLAMLTMVWVEPSCPVIFMAGSTSWPFRPSVVGRRDKSHVRVGKPRLLTIPSFTLETSSLVQKGGRGSELAGGHGLQPSRTERRRAPQMLGACRSGAFWVARRLGVAKAKCRCETGMAG